jgi:hypothetical protein
MASLAADLGELALARESLAAGLAIAELRQDAQVLTYLNCSISLGFREGDLVTVQACAERLLVMTRRMGHVEGQRKAFNDLGTVAHLRGDRAEASALYRETLALREATPMWFWAQMYLGYLELEAGRVAEVAFGFHEGLEHMWSQRNHYCTLQHLSASAALARAQCEWARAARLLGAADANLDRMGGVMLLEAVGRLERERTLTATREQLGEPAFADAYAGGRTLSLEQAVAEALAEDDE